LAAEPKRGFAEPLAAKPDPAAALLAELLLATGRGDREAFAELYRQCSPQLFGIALRIVRERARAEDVLQESFVAVWRRARDFDPRKGAAMTWLVTILRHRAIDALRRGVRQPERTAEGEAALLQLAAGPADATDRSAALAALQRCLGELADEPRHAMLMIYAYGFTQEELAARMKTPLGTVKSWVRRSLERLKRCLDG